MGFSFSPNTNIRQRGTENYALTFAEMQQFTTLRDAHTPDEIWLLEHLPVYTQGQAGKEAHILLRNNIEIVQSDRGGQITYHGPGQLIAYFLVDLQRKKYSVRDFVCFLEQLIIQTLATFNIPGQTKIGAPGVYVLDKKIASVGLRVKKGCTYHGIALNVNMDLTPFNAINPCGYPGLHMTQVRDYVPNITLSAATQAFLNVLSKELSL